jgi:cob(I)alamin adenosyltransferase
LKIYTKRGDQGETSLLGGQAISKASPRVSAYGDVDELNATIGLARAAVGDGELEAVLAGIQEQLFELGAELAAPPGGSAKASVPLSAAEVQALEAIIDRFQAALPPQKHFVLPAGTQGAAALHLARTVCRRAERSLVHLAGQEAIGPQSLVYLNRLSDLLFTLARAANQRSGIPDTPWIARRPNP